MYRLMKLSMGYVKWEKKQEWYVNYTRLPREQNGCVCEYTHALTPVLHILSLEGVFINRKQGLPQRMETIGLMGQKSGKGRYFSLYALLNHLIFKNHVLELTCHKTCQPLLPLPTSNPQAPREQLALVPRHTLRKGPSKVADAWLAHPPLPGPRSQLRSSHCLRVKAQFITDPSSPQATNRQASTCFLFSTGSETDLESGLPLMTEAARNK